MRILWLSHLIPYPPKGGVLQRCYYLISELSKYHDIDLMTFIQEDLLMSFYKDREEGIKDSKNVLELYVDNVEFFEIPSEKNYLGKKGLALKGLFSLDGYNMEWLKSTEFSFRLQSKLSENKYDVVHFDTISLAIYKRLVKDSLTTLDHHNIESHMMLRRAKKESNLLKKVYFYQEGLKLAKHEKKYCKKFDLNITCSDMDVQRLQDVTGTIACASVPNGVDIEYFKPAGTQKREKSLIFIGTMNWYPNIEAVEFIIKEIWPSLKKYHPDAILDIVGASPPPSIQKHNGVDGIHIHGFVDDIRPLFDSACIYICPITDGGGTKLKILDAMSMGKAILAHPIACEGINVTNGLNVMFCEDAEKFISSVNELFNDNEKAEFLEKNARKLAVDEYSFENIGKRLSNLFEQISSCNLLK